MHFHYLPSNGIFKDIRGIGISEVKRVRSTNASYQSIYFKTNNSLLNFDKLLVLINYYCLLQFDSVTMLKYVLSNLMNVTPNNFYEALTWKRVNIINCKLQEEKNKIQFERAKQTIYIWTHFTHLSVRILQVCIFLNYCE